MAVNFEPSVVNSDWSELDLRIMCGPRYNSFGPDRDRREEPGKFFERATWKVMAKPRAIDEETERWDGLA